MSPMSKRIAFALSFLLLLPAIATVAAPAHPTISTPTISPASPVAGNVVTVNMTVTANAGIQNVTVHYTTDNWKTNTTVTASYNSTTHIALAHIPPLYSGGEVQYFIVAYDNNGNKSTNDNGGSYYTYNVPAPTLSKPLDTLHPKSQPNRGTAVAGVGALTPVFFGAKSSDSYSRF